MRQWFNETPCKTPNYSRLSTESRRQSNLDFSNADHSSRVLKLGLGVSLNTLRKRMPNPESDIVNP